MAVIPQRRKSPFGKGIGQKVYFPVDQKDITNDGKVYWDNANPAEKVFVAPENMVLCFFNGYLQTAPGGTEYIKISVCTSTTMTGLNPTALTFTYTGTESGLKDIASEVYIAKNTLFTVSFQSSTTSSAAKFSGTIVAIVQ